MESEQQLLTLVIQGDRKAQRRLYERFAGMVTAIALRYVGNGERVNDVVQDTFLKAFSQIGNFKLKHDGALKAWVARLTVNSAIDMLRTTNKIKFTDNIPDVPDEEPDIRKVSDQELSDMIGQLPEGCRTVLNLFVFERLSHQEIAQRLGIKADTSASQYAYAKKLLAKMIKRKETK